MRITRASGHHEPRTTSTIRKVGEALHLIMSAAACLHFPKFLKGIFKV